jgi:hypothetical protein
VWLRTKRLSLSGWSMWQPGSASQTAKKWLHHHRERQIQSMIWHYVGQTYSQHLHTPPWLKLGSSGTIDQGPRYLAGTLEWSLHQPNASLLGLHCTLPTDLLQMQCQVSCSSQGTSVLQWRLSMELQVPILSHHRPWVRTGPYPLPGIGPPWGF